MSRRPGVRDPFLRDLFGGYFSPVYAQVIRSGAGQLPALDEFIDGDNLVQAVVTRGRTSLAELPEPATLSVLGFTADPPQPGDRLDCGLANELDPIAGTVAAERLRFAGEIADVDVAEDLSDFRAGDEGKALYQILATDQRARVNRWEEGATPWPQEDAGIRVARILNSAGTGLSVIPPAGTSPAVLARDVDRASHGGLIDEISEWTGGVLTLDRNVQFRWHPLGARGVQAPVANLYADQVDAAVRWSVRDGERITRARVTYGTADPQAQVEAVNELAEIFGSLAGLRDRRSITVTTQLATAGDAQRLADDLVGRRSLPQWRPSTIRVDLDKLLRRGTPRDNTTVGQLLRLHDEQLIRLAGFAAVPGAPTDGSPGPRSNGLLWVIGRRETYTPRSWVMELYVAPYELLADPISWDDVDEDVTWETAPQWPNWITSRLWQPVQLDTGTWLDVPAGLRWADLDPLVEWQQALDADDLTT